MNDLRVIMLTIANQLAGTYINVDRFAGNQCWDSAARVSQLMGLPIINTGGKGRWPGWAGNMWDAFPQSKEIDAAYYRVGPDQPAMPGDKAIWGDSYYFYPATHVADVIADAGGLLLCLSQNSSGAEPSLPGYDPQSSGPTIIQHLPKNGLLGYIRPRAGIALQGEITEQEDTLSEAEVREIKDHINAVMIGGYVWGDEKRPGVAAIVTENQHRIDAGNSKLDGITSIIVPGEKGKRDAGPLFGLLATMRGENAGLLVALRATGAGQPVNLEEVKAASKQGAAEALADLQATATTTVTLSQEG